MKDRIKSAFKWFFDSFIWLGLILLIADLVSKLIIVANKETILSQGGVVLIPGFLRVNYLINNTLVFGISLGSDLANRISFCIVASLIVIGLIIFLALKFNKVGKYYRACLMMILAGAIGNLIDRIFYSPEFLYSPLLGETKNGVVDWIDFYGIWKFNFNIADSAVVVAAFMLIIYMLVTDVRDYVKNKKENPRPVKEDNTKVLSKTEREKQQYLDQTEEHKDE